jgi:shikimate kinase
MKINIVLIGFMGSGKSSVGEKLSHNLNMDFLDMDLRIQEKLGVNIQEIFKNKGEAYFRGEELQLTQEIEGQSNVVIATGGGVVLQPECINLLSKNGVIFYLKCSLDTIFKRVQGKEMRPLYDHQNLEEFKRLFQSRLKLYEVGVNYIINSDEQSIENICTEIIKIVKKNNYWTNSIHSYSSGCNPY